MMEAYIAIILTIEMLILFPASKAYYPCVKLLLNGCIKCVNNQKFANFYEKHL